MVGTGVRRWNPIQVSGFTMLSYNLQDVMAQVHLAVAWQVSDGHGRSITRVKNDFREGTTS